MEALTLTALDQVLRVAWPQHDNDWRCVCALSRKCPAPHYPCVECVDYLVLRLATSKELRRITQAQEPFLVMKGQHISYTGARNIFLHQRYKTRCIQTHTHELRFAKGHSFYRATQTGMFWGPITAEDWALYSLAPVTQQVLCSLDDTQKALLAYRLPHWYGHHPDSRRELQRCMAHNIALKIRSSMISDDPRPWWQRAHDSGTSRVPPMTQRKKTARISTGRPVVMQLAAQ